MIKNKGFNDMMTTTYERLKSILSTFNNILMGKSPPGRFLRYYLLVIIIGTALLYSKMVHTDPHRYILDSNGQPLPIPGSLSRAKVFHWWDALFTASSAFSDTGLTVTNISQTFNLGGQFIILMLIQIGGFGYMTIKILIWKAFRLKISLNETILIQAERGRSKLGGSADMVMRAIKFIFIVEIIGAIVLSIMFYYEKPEVFSSGGKTLNMYHNFRGAVWGGLFHSISAINNAGFDIIGGNSLGEYRYAHSIQSVIWLLFIIGGIGFPVIDEINQKIKSKVKGTQYLMSVFVKVSLITYVLVALVGFALTFWFEYTAPNVDIPHPKVSPVRGGGYLAQSNGSHRTIWHNTKLLRGKFDRFWAILFNSMSTRNAGFATVPMDYFTEQSQVLFTILMFIGAAPSSTAGGIRTTTFALIILAMAKVISGKKDVEVLNRKVNKDTVMRALVVFAVGIFVLFLGTIILLSSAQSYDYFSSGGGKSGVFVFQFSAHDALFETASAFGTTGLSTGLTAYIDTYGKIFLVFVMFAGQLGISNSLTAMTHLWDKQSKRSLSQAEIIIG